jgi:serine/threonine protein kinase
MTESKGKILVVDDEPFIRKSINEVLTDEGYEVKEAENSARGLELLSREAFDIIFMDIQMPGKDGMETLKEIARENYSAETIMISGHGNIETAVEAMKFGAYDFMQKPFSMAKLKETVKNLMERRRQSRTVRHYCEVGKSIGRYRLEREIASGGMATLYRAEQSNLRKKVALKIMHPHLTKNHLFVQRFEHEARSAASLSHPNIVQVFDFGRQENFYFIAMEFIDGDTLESLFNKNSDFPLNITAVMVHRICMALDAAHANNIIHRDIKPANILISKKGHVKLTDFGIARCIDEQAAALTEPGKMVGTPQFMSPEQIQGLDVAETSDIFSLGVLLSLMTTRHYPFPGENIGAVVQNIIECRYTSAKSLNPEIPGELEDIISKCLQKDPDKRYGNTNDLQEDLQKFLSLQGISNTSQVLIDFVSKASFQ